MIEVENNERLQDKEIFHSEKNEKSFDDFDNEAQGLSKDIDDKVLEFEKLQNFVVERCDEDALSDSQIINEQDLDQIKKQFGVSEALERLREEAFVIRDTFKMKILDVRMDMALKSAEQNDGSIYIKDKKFSKFLKKLTSEEVQLYPEVVSAIRKQIVEDLKNQNSNNFYYEKDLTNHYLQRTLEVVSSQPEIIADILGSDEVLEIQEKLFLKVIYSSYKLPSRVLVESIHMNIDSAKNILTKAIERTVHGDKSEYGYIYNIGDKIREFELGDEFRNRVALQKIVSAYKTDYPYPQKNILDQFGFDKSEIEKFVQHNKDILTIEAYDAWINDRGNPNFDNYAESQLQYMGLDLYSLDSLKLVTNLPDSICERICNSENKTLFKAAIKNFEKFQNKSIEELNLYIKIQSDIDDSPSQEIVRIKDQLIEQILSTDTPEKSYELVKNIFVQNNLPVVGKVQRIFDALYPEKIFQSKLSNESSPVLVNATSRRRKQVVFEDLLKVHIESGNRSLKQFLLLIQDSDELVQKLEYESGLTQEEQEKLSYIFNKLKTISDVLHEKQSKNSGVNLVGILKEDYKVLSDQLGVKSGQSMSERVIEMFARPMGYENIESVLSEMERSKNTADMRNREAVKKSLILENGDLVKGIDEKYLDNILQNGSVAKEFLGSDADSDSTPFDTDVELVEDASLLSEEKRFTHQMKLASGYGNVYLVVKDRGQFQRTEKQAQYDRTKYELFSTLNSNHYGIRTGFPITEVDFMITSITDQTALDNLKYSIAQNGFYIPLANDAGELIYSPDQFDQYRKIFAGVNRFEGKNIAYSGSGSESYYSEMQSIRKEKMQDRERMQVLQKEIRSMIMEVLQEKDITFKGEYDDSLVSAEFLDIGSTGRGTNLPGDGDFDFNLKLDAKDWGKVYELSQEIIKKLGPSFREHPIIPDNYNNYQLRFFGTNIFSQKGIDIDIGFVKKSELSAYASHDAIIDKLENIRQVHGEEAYNDVIANILLAKTWLKEGKAYKKGDHGEGGLGGIGIENLVLAHNGNVRDAFLSFRDAALQSDGSIKSFEQFKKEYKVLDAGVNLRYNNHDNFVLNMNSNGYKKMLTVIDLHFPQQENR